MGIHTEALLRPTEKLSEFLLRDPLLQQARNKPSRLCCALLQACCRPVAALLRLLRALAQQAQQPRKGLALLRGGSFGL